MPTTPARIGSHLPKRVRRSYLAKLISAFLVIVVLVAAAGGYTYVTVSNELHESVHEEMETFATLQAEELAEWMNDRESTTRMLSEYAVMSSGNYEQMSAFLGGELENLPSDFVAVHYIDLGSKVILASSSDEAVGETVWPESVTMSQGSLTFDDNDEISVTEIYEGGEGQVMSFVSPVPGTREQAVVVTADVTHLKENFYVPIEGSFVQVVNAEGTVEFDERGQDTHESYAAGDAKAIEAGSEGESGSYEQAANGVLGERHVVAYAPAGNLIVVAHAPASSAYHIPRTIGIQIAALVLIVLLGLGGLGVVLNRNTVEPLRELSDRVGRLRRGEIDIDLATDREDEFGAVLEGVDGLRDDLRAQREEASGYATVMRQAAAGDLTVRMDIDARSTDMRTIATAFNNMMDALQQTVVSVTEFGRDVNDLSDQVAASVGEVNEASQEVSSSVEGIAAGADEQAESLTALTHEMDDLSASIEQIASSADELASLTNTAASEGEAGREAALEALDGIETIRHETEETVEAIEVLDDRVAEIGRIVGLITDIAEQTNILALNANIEAARAGDAGEGFAVVSHEVKALAEETRASAAEIEDLIDDLGAQREEALERMERMRERVADGSESVEAAVDALESITDRVEDTDASVHEINDATDDQATSSQEVLTMADEVAGISEETTAEAETVSAAAEEQTAALAEVASSARELDEGTTQLARLLGEFVVDGVETDLDLRGDANEENLAGDTDGEAPMGDTAAGVPESSVSGAVADGGSDPRAERDEDR